MMDLKKEYMKLFKKNLFLNKKKSNKVLKEVSEDIDQVIKKYKNQKDAFNKEIEPAIYRAHRLTKKNSNYLEDMGLVNAIKYSGKVPHLNLKTKMKVGNLPLIHYASGFNHNKGSYDVTNGVISIGNKARGLIAIGKMAYGLIAIGAVSIGILSVGVLSAGIFTIAAVAFSLILSLGGISISAFLSMGGLSISSIAASGKVAVANFIIKSGETVSSNIPGWFEYISGNINSLLLFVELILIAIGILIFYFDYISRYNYKE